MLVKFIVAGVVYFTSISIKSAASNKCYRAKICIHDGKEKCGQDLEGNLRRFLDSCDMKEYNCIQNSNYLKTNPAKCQNLPVNDKKPSAHDTLTDHDNSEQNQDDDNGKSSGESNMEEIEADKSNLKASQEEGDNSSSTKDDVDRISEEEGVEEANDKDQIVEVDVVIVSEENKEDRANEKDEVDREAEEEGNSKENGDDKVHEENDGLDRINNSNESRKDEINGMSDNNSSVSKLIKEHDLEEKSKEDSYDKIDEDNVEDGVDGVNDSSEPRENDKTNGMTKIVTCNCTSKLHNENDDDEDNNRNRSDDAEKTDKLLAENVYDTDESD